MCIRDRTKISGAEDGSGASGLKGTEDGLSAFCEAARKTCAGVLERHKGTPPVEFNRDERFSEIVKEATICGLNGGGNARLSLPSVKVVPEPRAKIDA